MLFRSDTQEGIVTASTLNIRSGAGIDHSIITKAYKNDKVEILETSNRWYKVKLSNGKVGWGSSDYISKSSSSNNTQIPSPNSKAQAIVKKFMNN